MPPPTPYSATPLSASTTTVRMATLKHARGPGAPSGARYAHRSRVDASRRILEVADDLHGPHLGRPRHRPAREQRPQHVRRPKAGKQAGRSRSTSSATRSRTARSGRAPARGPIPGARSCPGRSAADPRSSRSRRDPSPRRGGPVRPRRPRPPSGRAAPCPSSAGWSPDRRRCGRRARATRTGRGTRPRAGRRCTERAVPGTGRGRAREGPTRAGRGAAACSSPGTCRRPECARGWPRCSRRTARARSTAPTAPRARRPAAAGSPSSAPDVRSARSKIASHTRGRPRERIAVVARADDERRVETGCGLVRDEPGHPVAAAGGGLGFLQRGDHVLRPARLEHAERAREPERDGFGPRQVVEASLDVLAGCTHPSHDRTDPDQPFVRRRSRTQAAARFPLSTAPSIVPEESPRCVLRRRPPVRAPGPPAAAAAPSRPRRSTSSSRGRRDRPPTRP